MSCKKGYYTYRVCTKSAKTLNLHSDFEDSKKPESSQNRQTKRARLWFEMRPYNFEYTARYNKAIKSVERGLKVTPWSQSPHS